MPGVHSRLTTFLGPCATLATCFPELSGQGHPSLLEVSLQWLSALLWPVYIFLSPGHHPAMVLDTRAGNSADLLQFGPLPSSGNF